MKISVYILFAFVLLLSSFCYGTTITLNATIYDTTSALNPDMENTDGNENPDKGIVKSTIGDNRKPVYAHGSSPTKTVHNSKTFNTWFRNTTGVNMPIQYKMTLTKSGGVYTFSDCSFFPIDNKGFGNENLTHNYHFCLELHSSFTYLGGETLKFVGDDDIFVFINKKLVIDLGGIHSAENQTISLDDLGLTQNQTYKFDLFFCERHVSESVLEFQTTAKLFCEYIDRCGACEGDGESCACDCDDGDPCTEDTCDVITGVCSSSTPKECSASKGTVWSNTYALVGIVVGGTAAAGASVFGGKKAFDKYKKKEPQPATSSGNLFYKFALRKQPPAAV